MTLYELKIGKSKKKMHTQMISALSTINKYLKSRDAKGNMEGKFKDGMWYSVSLAPKNSKEFYKSSSTIGGHKYQTVVRINKHGQTSTPGYISKSGFNPHT